ncbi:MAG: glucosaminidase domain-containing protein, partial [Urechidicola sp.]|nr:glucosaminidase domain-containing protein [Urechidicola sp.]
MKIKILTLLLASLFLVSCGAKRKSRKASKKNPPKKEVVTPKKETPAPPKKYTDVKLQYIDMYSEIAMEEMRRYKIPASITLAQGILESSSGQSGLTTRSNNHFGIKCHRGWTGGKTYHDDDEKGECFRVYEHPEESFRDHSLFLAERTRYADLFKLKITDYKGWAKGLRKAGYATDKRYPEKLITIIETYDLYQYDKKVLGKKYKRAHKKDKEPAYYEVKKGDTLYSISRKYGLTVDKLKSINGLDSVS